MPSAMTTPPKKKRDFFNASQGLDFRDLGSPEPQEIREETLEPEGAYSVDERHASCSYSATPPIGVAFPSSLNIGHPSAEYYASCHDEHSPSVGYHRPPTEQERCSPITSNVHPYSPVLEFDDSSPLAEASAPLTTTAAAENPQWPVSSMTVSLPCEGDGDGDDGKKKGKKRKQRCSLCAKHGYAVDVKGHKWYCPYKNPQHTCEKCESTSKRQFLAKQRWTAREREQPPHLQDGLEGEAGAEVGRQTDAPVTFSDNPSGFPRMQELLEETNYILDDNFILQLEECMPSKATHH